MPAPPVERTANIGATAQADPDDESDLELKIEEHLHREQVAVNADDWFHNEREKAKQRKQEEKIVVKKRERKKSKYKNWSSQYRIGMHLAPPPEAQAARGAAQQMDRAKSLVAWLEASEFSSSSSCGSVFSVQAPPNGYMAGYDEDNQPWLWHDRTRVLVLPIRLALRVTKETKNEIATVFHYTCERAALNMANSLARGKTPEALIEQLDLHSMANSVDQSASVKSNTARTKGDGASLRASALEPAKFGRNRDILRDVLGHAVELEGKLLRSATHCIPLAVPHRALTPSGGMQRPDRVTIHTTKLKTGKKPTFSAIVCKRIRDRCMSAFQGRTSQKAKEMQKKAERKMDIAEVLKSAQRPDNSLRLTFTRSPRELREMRREEKRQRRVLGNYQQKPKSGPGIDHANMSDLGSGSWASGSGGSGSYRSQSEEDLEDGGDDDREFGESEVGEEEPSSDEESDESEAESEEAAPKLKKPGASAAKKSSTDEESDESEDESEESEESSPKKMGPAPVHKKPGVSTAKKPSTDEDSEESDDESGEGEETSEES